MYAPKEGELLPTIVATLACTGICSLMISVRGYFAYCQLGSKYNMFG
jgi:hypothetical protein